MTILLRHVLPNIRGTLLTVIALAYTSMLEGAVLTETVFSWPGIGRYLTTALFAGDLADTAERDYFILRERLMTMQKQLEGAQSRVFSRLPRVF